MLAEEGVALQQLLQGRPQLKSQVKVVPHVYRGQRWFLVLDTVSGTQLLIDESGCRLVNRMDGVATVEQIVAGINDGTDNDLSLDEVGQLVGALVSAEMLTGEMVTRSAELYARRRSARAQKTWRRLTRPLAIQFPLLDPQRLLTFLLPVARIIFSAPGFLVWLVVVLVGASVAIEETAALQAHWQSRFLDPDNLVWLWLVYPVIKGLHEIGHGLVARLWGAEVHEMGIMLLVFMPIPYVDASATNAFYNSRHRLTVAAAGILVESFLAAVAVICFRFADPGLGRDLMYNIIITAGLSTILFNGNPLLRFDGYYVLSDAIQVPNLATRSYRYLGYLFKHYLLGFDERRPATAPGEPAWLVSWGIAATIYRVVISFAIALFVAGQFFAIGVLLAGWFGFQLLRPVATSLWRLIPAAIAQQSLARTIGVLATLVGVVTYGLFFLPLTQSSHGEGITAPPDSSYIRVETPGFVARFHATSGQWVEPGDVIVELRDDELVYQEQELVARGSELEASLGAMAAVDRSEAEGLRQELATLAAELAEKRRDQAALTVRSKTSGWFSPAIADDLVGRYAGKGDVLGFVTNAEDWRVKVLIPQEAIDLVRRNVEEIQVVSWASPADIVSATWFSEQPLAVDYLPSRALGSQGGGVIPVDARDLSGERLLRPMFEVQLQLPLVSDRPYRIGERYVVRFVHGTEPVGYRLYRWFRRTLLRSLQV